jgi:ATP-dependent DNA ligase
LPIFPNSRKAGREGLTPSDMAKCIWLQPELVAAIEYVEWTPANHLRHSALVALRDDKDPLQVVRETL